MKRIVSALDHEVPSFARQSSRKEAVNCTEDDKNVNEYKSLLRLLGVCLKYSKSEKCAPVCNS